MQRQEKKSNALYVTTTNDYDDDNIPESDLPNGANETTEPLPESTRPRKDGPGGD